MIVLRDRSRGTKNVHSVPKQRQVMQWKSIFGKYGDCEMLSMLQRLALDPANSKVTKKSNRPLWNQILRLRKVMTLSSMECPQRKRKLQQYLNDKFKDSSRLAPELLDDQPVQKVGRVELSHASPVSSLIDSCNNADNIEQKAVMKSSSPASLSSFEGGFQEKEASSSLSSFESSIDWNPSIEDISSMSDSDESTCDTIPKVINFGPLPSPPSSVWYRNSILFKLKEPKSLDIEPSRRSIRIANFIGDHLQRVVIPIGPRFQADVPEWKGQISCAKGSKLVKNYSKKECSDVKWLGTRIWPPEGTNLRVSYREIGKGRPNSCSCVSPGCNSCIKRHIHEERTFLLYDLGPVFFSWRFDEMGEIVSLGWTQTEQDFLNSLAKKHPKNFLKLAFNGFPLKCKGSIVNYYLNVLCLEV